MPLNSSSKDEEIAQQVTNKDVIVRVEESHARPTNARRQRRRRRRTEKEGAEKIHAPTPLKSNLGFMVIAAAAANHPASQQPPWKYYQRAVQYFFKTVTGLSFVHLSSSSIHTPQSNILLLQWSAVILNARGNTESFAPCVHKKINPSQEAFVVLSS